MLSPNALAGETSPYLLQHAYNPVQWHPWGPAALERARAEEKPILLSVGYSACHWCHVMAHESFEDAATAALMNELFVNIKVDREERPDIDRIYQLAHQVLTRRGGGWPLTMFLTHDDQRPFFGGTYFPREARRGLPAFRDILQRVAEYYRTSLPDIRQQNESLLRVFDDATPAAAAPEAMLDRAPLRQARERLAQTFDPEFGGFGGEPKFPQPTSVVLLLRSWRNTASTAAPDLHSLYMASLTLTRMAEGGVYDQLGGGFYRYSADRYWMIPHFEKMLYDNAQLLRVYAEAALATGESLFRRVASETADWALCEMQATQLRAGTRERPDAELIHQPGGFYSAMDADSEGHEGRFYVWSPTEVRRILNGDEYEIFSRRFGLDREANFDGNWHLHVYRSLEDVVAELNDASADAAGSATELAAARAKLLAVRDRRVWPERDEKILTSWNGLMVSGLAVAARALQRPELAANAERCADFIRSRLWRDGRLLAVHTAGRSHLAAYLDDYAFLLEGLLELLQTRWRSSDLEFAVALADMLLEHFEDPAGGFFFTADDHEALIHRSKTFADEALPAGNAVAAQALNRLGQLLGENRFIEAAERAVRAGRPSLERYPQDHAALLLALDDILVPVNIVIVRGVTAEVVRWRQELARMYLPKTMIFAIPDDAIELPPGIAAKATQSETVAYVCQGSQCSAPIKSLTGLAAIIRG